MKLHPSLARQLAKLKLTADAPPSEEQWRDFVERVNQTYEGAEQDRIMAERSLEISSQEMQQRWQQLQKSEALINSILNSALDAIITVDREGRVVSFNPSAERIFGMRRTEIAGHFWEDTVAPFFPPSYQEFLAHLLTQGQHANLNVRTVNRITGLNGNEIPVELVVTAADQSFTIFVRDLTEQRKMETTLESQRTKILASSKMAALGEMAGGIAHEINTPLAVISMRVEQLQELQREGALELTHVEKALDVISRTSKRIAKIITGLRFFASNGKQGPMQETTLNAIVEDTLSFCRERLKNATIQLDFTPDPAAAPIPVICRPVEVSQVLLNLLNNAHDAIADLPDRWIRVDVRETAEWAEIVVTDSGPGIPPEIREKIMQPFFTTKEIGKGTGLGLSISKGIMDTHHGHLTLDPSASNTCFVMQLPKPTAIEDKVPA